MNLFVGLDHLASLREAGGTRDPDPVIAGALAELGGAGGLSISVGREGNGVQERDLRLLRETTRTVLNVCCPRRRVGQAGAGCPPGSGHPDP
jgi:pyridoxine 5-phosphate synthase